MKYSLAIHFEPMSDSKRTLRLTLFYKTDIRDKFMVHKINSKI